MRYVPNLIPPHSRVLTDYFKENIFHGRQRNSSLIMFGWIFGLAFLALCIIFLMNYPICAILFGLLSLIVIPPGHAWIEKKLQFNFNSKIKAAFISVIVICLIPSLNSAYGDNKQKQYAEKLRFERQEKARIEHDKQERQRNDSLHFYIESSDKFELANRMDLAIKDLNCAIKFALTEDDRNLIVQRQVKIESVKVFKWVKEGKYKSALPALTDLIIKSKDKAILFYKRAVCYSKTGEMQYAVNDLKQSSELGYSDAQDLLEKINPIRKRVSYYITRCCDGSESNAKGRGACSHHGGVCNWNEPVYEEYRQYN